MRNLKRALSLALALVMVMSVMIVGANAASYDDFSDKDEIVNKEAVTVLSTLNVINGKDDGSYDPTGIVTRAEMAKIICVVLNGGSDPALGASTTHTYTDTVNHWAEAYIEYCTQLGIVAGKGNGTFDPNGTVTATEAAKMLLVALGYNANFENMVGSNWAISTNVLANQNKLYAGLDIDVDAGLTRDNAAQMAYNALNCEMVAYTYALVTGADGSLTSIPRVEKKDDTLLSDKFGGVRVEGVVVKNEQTSKNFDGKTVIDITNGDELAKVGHNFVTTSGNTVNSQGTFEVSTDASLLGTSVFFYVVPSVASPNNTEKATVLGSVMDSGKNTVVSTNADFGDDTINDYMDAEDIDLQMDGSTVDYTTCVNGSKVTDIDSLVPQVNGYEIKFIDNDNDGVTEYVVQTTYGFGKVTRYDDASDGGLTIDTLTASKDYKVKEIVGFEDVAKGDYVVYNEMGGKLYVSVAETVTGTMETFKANATYYKANLTVDGTAYKFSGGKLDYNKNDSVLKDPMDYTNNTAMGKEVVLYLDKFGYVAATSDVKAFTDYAYVANVQTNNDATAMSGAIRVYVVMPDGTEASYIVNNFNGSDTFTKSSIHEGEVYGYYLTSDGKIDLTSTNIANTAIGTTGNTVKYTSGDATIYVNGSSFGTKVDSSTVFYYAILKDNKTEVKSVEVYGGKDAAPSFEVTVGDGASQVLFVDYNEPVTGKDGVAEAVIVTTEKVSSDNILYLYQYVKSNGENAIYNAVIDGKIVEGIAVDSKATDLAGAPYTYTITSKGAYQLTANPNYTLSGFVTLVDGKSVVVAGKEVKITDSTSMAEIDGSDTAIVTSVTKNDYVTVVYDNNDNATGLFITEPYATDSTGVLGVNKTVLTKTATGYQTTETSVNNILAAADTAADIAANTKAVEKIVNVEPTTLAGAKANTNDQSGTLSAGTYWIVVISEDEDAYSATKLVVAAGAAAPSFDTDLSSTQTGFAALTVEASTTDGGALSYQWYKDGAAISGATGTSYTPTEAGTYYVVVTNTLNGTTAAKKSTECVVSDLDTTAAPTVLTLKGQDVTADGAKISAGIGEEVTFAYTVTNDQFITIKINGREMVSNAQGNGTFKFNVTSSNITNGVTVDVLVTEDGHNDYTAAYTVAVEKAKTANVTFALTTPSPDGSNTISGGGATEAVTVNAANTTAQVVLTGTKTAAQTVEISGENASLVSAAGTDTNPTYTVNTDSIKTTGGSVSFTLTVNEAGYLPMVYTVTVTVAGA